VTHSHIRSKSKNKHAHTQYPDNELIK